MDVRKQRGGPQHDAAIQRGAPSPGFRASAIDPAPGTAGTVRGNPGAAIAGQEVAMQTPALNYPLTIAAALLVAIGSMQAAAKTPSDAQMIASAMHAAPARVAKDATIVAMSSDGKM